MMNTVETPLSLPSVEATEPAKTVGLEEYYSEAGPDYAAWSKEFNMHFGFFRWGMNPFRREQMLERMNLEVLERLGVDEHVPASVLDLGCGLGATMRTIAGRRPNAALTGITLVPWQVEQTTALNRDAGLSERIDVRLGDYQNSGMAPDLFDAVYAVESSCYAQGADKSGLLREAYRLLKPGGRLVVADGFLRGARRPAGLRGRIYSKLCECWVIDELGRLDLFVEQLGRLGFESIAVEGIQLRVAPSVFHIPWVTIKFLLTEVVFGNRKMTQARWNNVIAPVLLPFVGWPLGPMMYCMVTATKAGPLR